MTDVQLNEQPFTTVKGKIAVVIMTFNGDTHCLKQCLRGLEQQIHKGYNLEIFLLDDANHPLNHEEYSNYHYKKTYFDRRCNLNGTQCTLGMLMEMLRIARESKAEYIMKVDCDMYIRNLERFLQPLEDNPDLVIGFRLNNVMNYVAGVTYILPSKGLYNTIRNFYKWYADEKENTKEWISHCPEDWAITRSVAACNNFTLWQWQNAVNPHTWLLAPFNFREIHEDGSINPLCLTRYTMYDFVNFGNRHELTTEHCKCTSLLTDIDVRELAGKYMETFIDFDLNNTYN